MLGPDVEIEIEACDECNTIVDVDGVGERIRAAGGGMIGLIGAQSNQCPRALDLGRQFRMLGVPAVMGGFPVSGCIAMLPTLPDDLQEALDLGIHLFAGEACTALRSALPRSPAKPTNARSGFHCHRAGGGYCRGA